MSVDDTISPSGMYWLTRDRIGGELIQEVEIWAVPPERARYIDGDVCWFASDDVVDTEVTCLGTWTLEHARKVVGAGVPDTDRECTRIGRDLPPVTRIVP